MKAHFVMDQSAILIDRELLHEGDWFMYGELICVATDEDSYVSFCDTGGTVICNRKSITGKVALLDVTVTVRKLKGSDREMLIGQK